MFSNLHTRRRIENRRRGAIMVKMAVLLPVLIGFIGLTIDGGFLLTTKRQAQNAADAAALAAAMDLMRGHSVETALATANQFVQQENGLSDATPLAIDTNFHIPPITGPHIGKENYVEVVVSTPHQSFFMHILTGSESSNVGARAVAGFEAVTAGEGVMVLDPNPKNGTGLTTNGNGILKVEGRIVVNAEDPSSAAVPGKYGIIGHHIDVVGGVKNPELFLPYDEGAPSPLRTGALPEPDPLLELPIPTVGNGVDNSDRGEVSINNGGYKSSVSAANDINFVATAGQLVANGLHTATAGEVILHPGIYKELTISGGKVYMVPGIYVISPSNNKGFEITGGTVLGENVMIYNTGGSYNPLDGSPDSADGNSLPPSGNNNGYSGIKFTGGTINLNPINLKSLSDKGKSHVSMYSGAKAISADFDGMLFFQRRHNKEDIKITGIEGALTGTLYAKWALFDISGQGTYDAQFIAGSMSITGNGTVTILGAGDKRGRANNVFLVE